MVQTRSTTRKVEIENNKDNPEASPQDAPIQASSGEDLPRPTKRPKRLRQPQKSVSPSKKRRRGEAEELCQLNLDILFLIAEYIHPIDLLNLARTCKSLRALLMDRSSAFVWRKARGQTKGLPDCPLDLTEPEYANLVFHARCHGCGKYAQIIFWRMRRRYCPACRVARFLLVVSCDKLFWTGDILPSEDFALGNDRYRQDWVDREQMESFLQEYSKSSNKEDLLQKAQERCKTIKLHACQCESWKVDRAYARRVELEARRETRETSIFERLKQSGYETEITYYAQYRIRSSYLSAFKTSKPLTGKEWDRMRPAWFKIMDGFRASRLEETVYKERRKVLAIEHDRCMQHPAHDIPPSHLVPHVAYLANLPPFSGIIRAPEDTPIEDNHFASAFAQLPTIVEDWTKKVTAELVALIKIPSSLLPQDPADRNQDEASKSESASSAVSSQNDNNKLQLASALFYVCNVSLGPYAYPDVLSVSMFGGYPRWDSTESECIGSVVEELRIGLFEEAAYIVHACGLDPSTAMVDDMDRRNPRLMCLLCNDSCVMDWRAAMSHARFRNIHRCRSLTEAANRWKLIDDEFLDAIQAVERPLEESALKTVDTRCLLCQSHVGDSRPRLKTVNHLVDVHNANESDIKEGEHFVKLGIRYHNGVAFRDVKMVEEEGRPTFKAVEPN